MPQRTRQGSGLRVSSHKAFGKAKSLRARLGAVISAMFARTEVGCRPMVEDLEGRELLSTTYYVSPSGSNSNSGTLAKPFQTIQKAASVAGSGSIVAIETGTYHETVTPAHSGVTFEPYNNEKVTVTGADAITGWTKYSGNIYEASMPWTLGEGSDEIFVNGTAMNEAQFPNSPVGDFSKPATLTMQKVSGRTIYNSSLNQPTNYWKGAIIHMTPGQGWLGETGTVTSSAPGSITISYAGMGSGTAPKAGNTFYLFGTFKALDSAGEWYRDPSTGKLYLWAPNNANPATLDVEAKHRQAAFNLDYVSSTTIKGINIFASTILTSSTSQHTVINGINAQYIDSDRIFTSGWYYAPTDGLQIRGAYSTLENSQIAYATADGVIVGGTGSVITNNVIHDVDSVGADTGGVRLIVSGTTVSHNTIYNSGRHGILADISRSTITYNTIHDVGLQTTESGGVYTAGINGDGSVIAYNEIYNIHTAGYGGTAIFPDNGSSGWIIHNNTTFNVDYALKMNNNSNNNNIYDNTLDATDLSINSNQQGNWYGTSIDGNVFNKSIVVTPGAKIYNNVYSSSMTLKGVGAGDFASGSSI